MIFEELTLLHSWRRRGRSFHDHHVFRDVRRLARDVDVAGHQLELGVGVGCAAAVVQRHPAVEVEGCAILVEQHDVVGAPVDAVGQVGDVGLLIAGLLRVDLPDEAGLGQQPFGQRGEVDVADLVLREHGDGAAVSLQDHVVDRAQQGAGVGLRVLGLDHDHLVDVLLQQRGGADQVVLEVLLEDGRALGVGQRLERDAGGVDLCGHVGVDHLVEAAGERDGAVFADQGDVLVVDGQLDRLALGLGRRQRVGG